MRLYICPSGTADVPGPIAVHPCAKAAAALDEAGHRYEKRKVGGRKLMPWTRRGARAEIRRLSGQNDVPILVLDDGAVITGSGAIVRWARSHPASGLGGVRESTT